MSSSLVLLVLDALSTSWGTGVDIVDFLSFKVLETNRMPLSFSALSGRETRWKIANDQRLITFTFVSLPRRLPSS